MSEMQIEYDIKQNWDLSELSLDFRGWTHTVLSFVSCVRATEHACKARKRGAAGASSKIDEKLTTMLNPD